MFNTKLNQTQVSVTDTSDNGFIAQRLNFVLKIRNPIKSRDAITGTYPI